MKPKGETKRVLAALGLFMALLFALYIIGNDLGSYREQPCGAGDLWWADVPQIEQIYKKLREK